MFDELNKYKENDHFFFTAKDNLSTVCNAPTDKSGVYIVYALKNGKINLIYIGSSGEIKLDGTLFTRKAGVGGLKERLVNGKQFGEPRRNSWKEKIQEENIEALDVYWYVTHGENFIDCPKKLERKLLKKHFDIYGELPIWNNMDF
jgi:CTP:phosphocholine cytidylyltransferase-like protein